jgi:hypothetical protein
MSCRGEAVDIIMCCMRSEEHLETVIRGVQYIIPDKFQLDHIVREILEESKESFHNKIRVSPDLSSSVTSPSIAFGFWWQLFTGSLLGVFFLSCITHFAQYYQLVIDREDSNKLRKRLPPAARREIASPVSGNLKLPPPTPLLKTSRRAPESSSQPLGEACEQKHMSCIVVRDKLPIQDLHAHTFSAALRRHPNAALVVVESKNFE